MSFFTVEPETSGTPDSKKSGEVVSCLFDTWLGQAFSSSRNASSTC